MPASTPTCASTSTTSAPSSRAAAWRSSQSSGVSRPSTSRCRPGASARRHALRAVSDRRRAAQHLREAGGLRGGPAARAHDARRLIAHSMDRVDDPGALRRHARGSWTPVRRRQLEHVPGPARPDALLQVWKPDPIPTRRCAGRQSPTTSSASRSVSASGRRRSRSGSRTGRTFPASSNSRGRWSAIWNQWGEVYAKLPDGWRLFLEHKLYEPALYSTVIADWGTSYVCAERLGPKAQCLVDLGHHAPTVNIEMIVARLIQFGKARRVPFQRLEVRRRRPRHRRDRSVPDLPGVQ